MADTITLPRSVVEQALEALEHHVEQTRPIYKTTMAIEALIAALEQPDIVNPISVPTGWRLVPMEPTDSQIRAAQDTWWHACNSEMYWDQIYAAMIAAAPQPPALEQPQVEQEPVAWMYDTTWEDGSDLLDWVTTHPPKDVTLEAESVRNVRPLYIHSQSPRQPLTDEQIGEIEGWFSNEFGLEANHSIDFARAIERAHGIGGEA